MKDGVNHGIWCLQEGNWYQLVLIECFFPLYWLWLGWEGVIHPSMLLVLVKCRSLMFFLSFLVMLTHLFKPDSLLEIDGGGRVGDRSHLDVVGRHGACMVWWYVFGSSICSEIMKTICADDDRWSRMRMASMREFWSGLVWLSRELCTSASPFWWI